MSTPPTQTTGYEGTWQGGSDAAILDRIVQPDQPTFSPEAARGILTLDFGQADKDRMRQLSAKAREGTLTPAEQADANSYERVGHLLNILQSKARRSLKVGRGADEIDKAP